MTEEKSFVFYLKNAIFTTAFTIGGAIVGMIALFLPGFIALANKTLWDRNCYWAQQPSCFQIPTLPFGGWVIYYFLLFLFGLASHMANRDAEEE